jgi:hypothetical protein
MFAVVTPDTIHLPSGAVVRLLGSWQDYQALNEQLGVGVARRRQDHRADNLHQRPLLDTIKCRVSQLTFK